MGQGLSIAANRPDPNGDGGENRASQRASIDDSDDLEHLRVKAASAELQKKNTELLLRSEQQRNVRLNAALEELQKRHDDLNETLCTQREQNARQNARHIEAATQAVLKLDQQRKENEEMKTQLSFQNDQLVQTALQLDRQKKETEKMQDAAKKTVLELEEHKEEKTRLNQLISKKENQLVQQALEIERMTTELNNARRTLHNLAKDNANLKKENETLVSNGEELLIDFAQNNIKYNALETKHNAVEAKAKELSMINADLQSSTYTLQSAFGENVQVLDTLSAENAELKSKLQSMTAKNGDSNARAEHIMTKLQHRRELLALVKAARSAAETKADAITDKEPFEFDTAEKVQAGWESFVQQNDSIVKVLRGGEWVEAIAFKKEDSSLPWVQYCCDGSTHAVSEDKIRRKHKRPPPSYFESPPTPKEKKHKKERSFYIGVV